MPGWHRPPGIRPHAGGEGALAAKVRARAELSDPTRVGRGYVVLFDGGLSVLSDPTRVGRGHGLSKRLQPFSFQTPRVWGGVELKKHPRVRKCFRPHACGEGFHYTRNLRMSGSFRPHACGEGSNVRTFVGYIIQQVVVWSHQAV